jgi:hypothetical protein
MKSKDILNEGPIDFVKKVGAGVSGAASGLGGANLFKGFASGYGAAKSEIQAKQATNMTADRMFQDWAKVMAGLKASGQPIEPKNLEAWITQRFGGVRTKIPADLGNNSVLKFIRAEVGAYNAGLPITQSSADTKQNTSAEPDKTAQSSPQQANPIPTTMDVATWINFFKKLKPADKKSLRKALGI